MGKKKSKKTAPVQPKVIKENKPLAPSRKVQDIIFPLILAAILAFILKPTVFDGLSPQGVDVIASVGKNHKVNQWQSQSDEYALWNPNVFSGMPRYQRSTPLTYSVDTLLNYLGLLFSNIFMYYLFGALGFYLLMRLLRFSPLISFITASMFVLMPHYKALYLEGHNAKLRAVMIIPWITASFVAFLRNRTLLPIALFALLFGMQIRTQHYQVIYYTGLMIFAIGIYPVLSDLLKQKYQAFAKSSLLILAAVTLAILTAAQPLFLAKEYLPWSKRGKTTISLADKQKVSDVNKADGVTLEYATRWSTHPSELMTWIIPRFYGGTSREVYNGSQFPHLKGRDIPGYWGPMPFTQSYEYMGALTVILALIGFFFFRREKMVFALSLYAGFLILLSFGRHAEWFYSLFFNYMPFFNKFRAPQMSITVTYFIFAIFAGYGMHALSSFKEKLVSLKEIKPILALIGGVLLFVLGAWVVGQGLSFSKAGEPYNAETLNMIKAIRLEFFNADIVRFFAIAGTAAVSIFLFLKKKMGFAVLLLIMGTVSIIDQINIQNRSAKEFVNRKSIERSVFRQSSSDKAILKDKGVYRIFPLGEQFGSNRWSYYHASIGGYSPIKMFTIEEMVANNLRGGGLINPNIMKTLNVKYLIANQPINNALFTPIDINEQTKQYTYLYNDFADRAFFVGQTLLIEDEYKRVAKLNDPNLEIKTTAIIEEPLHGTVSMPDSMQVTLTEHTPNKTSFNVFTDKQALLVISELYYPPGWHIFLDGKEVEKIYKTNHAVQSIIVPKGTHKVEVKFAPASFTTNVQYATGALIFIYLVILSSLLSGFLKGRKQEQEQALKEDMAV